MKKERFILILTGAVFLAIIIYGAMRQERIKDEQRRYDNRRSTLAVGKINAKQDVNRELLMALYRETGADTAGLKAFDREYMDSLGSLEVLPK